jgi:hypothetical protein
MAHPRAVQAGKTERLPLDQVDRRGKGEAVNKPYVTCSDRETNIAEILWLIEAYGIKLEELEPDKAQPRPEIILEEVSES